MKRIFIFIVLMFAIISGCSQRYEDRYENGNLKSEGFKYNEKMNGEWKFYYKDGKIKATGHYYKGSGSDTGSNGIPKNGRDKEWKFYDEDGKIESENIYSTGTPVSIVEYHKNGIASTKRYFNRGVPDGHWYKIYSNGVIMEDCLYFNDSLKFDCIWYLPDGGLSGDRLISKRTSDNRQSLDSREGFNEEPTEFIPYLNR